MTRNQLEFRLLQPANSHRCVSVLPVERLTLNGAKPPAFPGVPVTLGDHLEKRRLELGNPPAGGGRADRGVCSFTVAHCKKGQTEPTIRDWPRAIAVLGYDPVPKENTIADRLLALRRRSGLSQRERAAKLGVEERSESSSQIRDETVSASSAPLRPVAAGARAREMSVRSAGVMVTSAMNAIRIAKAVSSPKAMRL